MWVRKGVPPPRNPNARWYHTLPTDRLWREISSSLNGGIVLVTLKRPDLKRGYFNGRVLVSEGETAQASALILRIHGIDAWEGPLEERQMPVMRDGHPYPALVIRLADVKALQELRSLPIVEAVAPLFVAIDGDRASRTLPPASVGATYVAKDGAGCSLPEYEPNPADGEFSDNRVPWTFKHLGIVDAWNLYKTPSNAIAAPGYPIRVGVVDTGVFENQQQLTTFFQEIGPRTEALNRTVVPLRWDDCGHGTRIAGLTTAPADSQNVYPREIVGVAWGANLTTVKYNSGVIAFAGSRVALAKAIRLAVDDGAKVINLAVGMPYWETFVADCITEIYQSSETLFVAAAGTNEPLVVFPAVMPQVLAVSIVRAKDTGNPTAGYEFFGGLLPESAYGEEVDFAAVNGDGDIPTTGAGGPNITSIGGSSSGTAHLSGIAALAWGKQPSATRDQVVIRLQRSASLSRISGEANLKPGTSAMVGFGIPDAYVAAGGARFASISGPSVVM